MIARLCLLAGASLLVAGSANAHTLVVAGRNADARACYESARDDRAWEATLPRCTRALEVGDLSRRDTIATHVNRGILRLRLSDVDGAIADFDSALAMSPRQPDALINKGIALLSRGDSDNMALTLIEQGLAGEPERPWVGYWARAVAHELAGRDAQAYQDYQRAEQLRPGWAPAREALARFSVVSG
jgi:tetratricopeptide (TPR) repeat protein